MTERDSWVKKESQIQYKDRFCSAKAVFILEEGVMNQPAFFSLMIERRDAVNHGYSVRHGFPVLRERNA